MSKVFSMTFVQPDGFFKEVDAPEGFSVLEIAQQNSIDLYIYVYIYIFFIFLSFFICTTITCSCADEANTGCDGTEAGADAGAGADGSDDSTSKFSQALPGCELKIRPTTRM